MASILFVRHAQSEWNAEHRWQGQADPPLSAHGRAQAIAVGTRLGRSPADETRLSHIDQTRLDRIDAIISSDLARARATADIIADAAGISRVFADPRLRERDVGDWQGLTTTEIDHRYPGARSARRYPHGWESDESLLSRTFAALQRAAELVGRGTALIVSHAGVIYMIERHFDIPFKRIENLRGRQITIQEDDMSMGERIALFEDDAPPIKTDAERRRACR